jgi:hypothetical protein
LSSPGARGALCWSWRAKQASSFSGHTAGRPLPKFQVSCWATFPATPHSFFCLNLAGLLCDSATTLRDSIICKIPVSGPQAVKLGPTLQTAKGCTSTESTPMRVSDPLSQLARPERRLASVPGTAFFDFRVGESSPLSTLSCPPTPFPYRSRRLCDRPLWHSRSTFACSRTRNGRHAAHP